ncbi:hypothetical protein BGZ79_008809 [Entomortierella chlamydospora]|nr:hypothetical protein BGZ79_008809 [Entomortierella chlamydospora]
MSLLDQLFGTDGRNKKDEGIWNWIKNQKMKSKNKSKSKNNHQILTRSLTSSPSDPHSNVTSKRSSTYSGSSLSTVCVSVPASSSISYTCSPSSPTASFKPSSSSSFPIPAPSPTFTESSRSSTATTLNMPASPTSSTSSSPSSSSTPSINSNRQRTQSAIVSSTHPFASSSFSFGEGPIKRSVSSKSTSSRAASTQAHYSNYNFDRSRSFSHGGPTGGIDDISETATTFFDNGDSEDETSTIGSRSMQQRQQRWSSPGGERELARRAEIRKARNDGWWWE